MIGSFVWTVLALAAGPVSADASDATTGAANRAAPPAIARRGTSGPARTLTWSFPGEVEALAFPRDASGARDIAVVVRVPRGPEDAASESDSDREGDTPKPVPPCPEETDETTPLRAVYRVPVRLDGTLPAVHPLETRVSPERVGIGELDLDGDGHDELWASRDGTLVTPGSSGAPFAPLVARDGLGRPSAAVAGVFAIVSIGRASFYGTTPSGAWGEIGTVDLPARARATSAGLSITTARLYPVGETADGVVWFASELEAVDGERLRADAVAIDRATGETRHVECWARLPEREDVLGRTFLLIDDRPHVLVETKPGDKLGLFSEKRLRLFELRRSRSRLGVDPVFDTRSRMNLWQASTVDVRDVDDDGDADLVVGYWKGLRSARVVLDVYPRLDDGRFDPRERTTAFDVKRADRSFLAHDRDVDGDGRPDLVLLDEEGVRIHRGVRSSDGKDLVASRGVRHRLTGRPPGAPTEVSVSSGGAHVSSDRRGDPALVDLDADGTVEIVASVAIDDAIEEEGASDAKPANAIRIVFADARDRAPSGR